MNRARNLAEKNRDVVHTMICSRCFKCPKIFKTR